MNNQPRILCITHSYVRYEGDILSDHILLLNKMLKSLGCDITVLAPHDDDIKRVEALEGILTYRFRYCFKGLQRLAYRGNMQELIARGLINKMIFSFFMTSYFSKLLLLIKKHPYDLIHAHWWIPSGFIASLASIFFRVPFVITVHGTDARLLKESRLLRKLAKMTFSRASKIVCVSEQVRNQLVNIIHEAENKTVVIPMPANEIIFYPIPSDRNRVHRILCVARFTKQKGVETLLRACAKLENNISRWRLQLIGEGPLEGHLKDIMRELHIHSKVDIQHFVNKTSLHKYYNNCDVMVLPSVDEGFGLVLIEAQLCKKLVIGADSGGIKDIIEDGVTGFLFKAGSDVALCKRILFSIENEELSHRVAQQGYEYALTHFSTVAISGKYQAILTNLTPRQ